MQTLRTSKGGQDKKRPPKVFGVYNATARVCAHTSTIDGERIRRAKTSSSIFSKASSYLGRVVGAVQIGRTHGNCQAVRRPR